MRSEEQVADFYDQQNRWNDAEELYRTLLGRAKEPKHLQQYYRKSLLAGVLVQQGKYEEAIALGAEVKEAFALSLGMDHPDTFDSISCLAHYHQKRHSYDRAMTLEHEALEGRKRLLGQYHLDTLVSMGNLANMYKELAFKQNDFDLLKKAHHLDVCVLKWRRRILGPNHPHTLIAMANLATTYNYWPKNKKKNRERAEKLEEDVLERNKKRQGERHSDTVQGMQNLASTRLSMGKYDDAETLLGEALEISRARWGDENPRTLKSMAMLALISGRKGNLVESKEQYIKVFKWESRVLGDTDTWTLHTMVHIAEVNILQRNWAQAPILLHVAIARVDDDSFQGRDVVEKACRLLEKCRVQATEAVLDHRTRVEPPVDDMESLQLRSD